MPHVELLTFNSVPIHRVNRSNRRDATPPLGEQVPHGAMLEAVMMLRQEVSTRDQNSLTSTDNLPYACVPTPNASNKPWTSKASGVGSVKSVLVDRELFKQAEQEKADKRLADAYEYERRAIAAAQEAAKRRAAEQNRGGFFACCQART